MMVFLFLLQVANLTFDFKKNTISINKTWGYLARSAQGFGPTKNEQSNRVIKINKRTMDIFKKRFDETPSNIHDLVFYSPSSKYEVISNTNANKLLKKVLTALNVHPITVHGLRHTHASILLYKRLSVYYVSERLGHRDIETTLHVYTHVLKELRQEDEQKAVKILDKMDSAIV